MIGRILNRARKTLIMMRYKLKFRSRLNYKKLYFNKGFRILIEKPGKLSIGNRTFFNNYCSINCLNHIEIGNNCLFGEGVKLYDHNHIFNIDSKLIRDCDLKCGEIIIGNNCWIGSNAVILSGTKIGDNCVIGAGAIVKGNIASNSILKTCQNYSVEEIHYKTEEGK
ncbi:MAG: acyltransferase [Anaeroplasmataceae bacterium]|nr:acyltransferase [Anaeroplasmataceae bacterium]MDE6414480.1 acyltransferase [Anaeroplasmataceae bacterium]